MMKIIKPGQTYSTIPVQKKINIIAIIPAFNEEHAILKVLADLPATLLSNVIVVNNKSTDKTAVMAALGGALVVDEPQQGYGYACLRGINYIAETGLLPDIIVFLDADYSDHPEELPLLIRPIIENNADLVIGSRALGKRESGSMTVPQLFGNWLATRLIRMFYQVRYTDLGPFRAIRWESLQQMNMCDKTYGWTVEMQLKAAKYKLKIQEVPVSYRVRIGSSKISGTIKGTLLAGYKIITTIFKYL
ncbi:MAG: glycosyltransferase family 2 protein [Mucilaginibacter sp.]